MEDLNIIILFLFVLFLLLTTIWSASSSWTLTALPLFIWMGEILYRTRLSEDMFKGLAPWMSGLPGGLVHSKGDRGLRL